MRCAVCCPRSDPPSTRERLSTAALPQARHRGVLFSLSNSHCTQNTADCNESKIHVGGCQRTLHVDDSLRTMEEG